MFCESYLLLFVKLHKHSSSSMSKATFKTNKSKSRSRYRLWVPPCPRYITSGDTQRLCVVCLGVKHAEAALEGADCPHCERLPLRTLHCRRVLFEEGAFTSVPRGAGPTSAEAERRLHSWGSQLDLAGESLSSSSPARSTDRSVLLLSSSEGVDVESDVSVATERCPGLNRHLRAICHPLRHYLWRLWSCPPNRCAQHQPWWERGTWQWVRLAHVCTLCQCYRRTKPTC